MSFRIVLVSLAFFFIARGFVRAVAEGLILGHGRVIARQFNDCLLLR